MKPRRVIVTVEVETGLALGELKDFYKNAPFGAELLQVQANVASVRGKKKR